MTAYRTEKNIILLCSMLLMFSWSMADQSFSQSSGSLSSIGSTVGGLGQGMARSFGVLSSDYIRSFRVINDTAGPIGVKKTHLKEILGSKFSGDSHSETIEPYSNSGSSFVGAELYYTLDIGSFNDKQWVLGKKKDPNIYLYRVYGPSDSQEVESLGVAKTTTQFSGLFFNDTTLSVSMKFTKDGAEHNVTIEPKSFALLSSNNQVTDSIRATSVVSFVFQDEANASNRTNLGIPPTGLGYTEDIPMLYTYNIDTRDGRLIVYPGPLGSGHNTAGVVFSDVSKQLEKQGDFSWQTMKIKSQTDDFESTAVARLAKKIQDVNGRRVFQEGMKEGLAALGVTAPLIEKVRDINPIPCHFWYQSAEQTQQVVQLQKTIQARGNSDEASGLQRLIVSNPFDNDMQSVWVYMKSKDQTIPTSWQFPGNKPTNKLTRGKEFITTVLRPQISEQEGTLYIVALDVPDQETYSTNQLGQIQKFFERLSLGLIGKKATQTDVSVSIKATLDMGGASQEGDESTPALSAEELAATLSKNFSRNGYGIIDDTDTAQGGSGLKGMVLLADLFLPTGIGPMPMYYCMKPPTLQTDYLASLLLHYCDPTTFGAPKSTEWTDAAQKALNTAIAQQLPNWIRALQPSYSKAQSLVGSDYTKKAVATELSGLVPGLTSFLKTHGLRGKHNALFDENAALTTFGARALYLMLLGPVSVFKPPFMVNAGANLSLPLFQDQVPNGWMGKEVAPKKTDQKDASDSTSSSSGAQKKPDSDEDPLDVAKEAGEAATDTSDVASDVAKAVV